MPRLLFAAFFLLIPALSARAQSGLSQTEPPRDQVEFGAASHSYDAAGITGWRSAVVRTQFARGLRMVWDGEAVAEHRFGEPSFAYKLQHSADFGKWITRISGRTSNGGFYNPKYRVDVGIGRKLPPSRKIILMLSGFYREVRDGHQDAGATVETQFYLNRWLIAQGSVRFQVSNPGNAVSRYQDFALTIGRHRKATVVLHGAFGSEAYQIIDPLVIYTNFDSKMARVVYRQWFSRSTGVSISGSWYSNPFYQRTGVEVSLFFGFNASRR
ncbi:MAG: YaiO family outer membrane protein [Rhodothermales bacterium]|jgi:YaiO family outer membrane protein